MNFENFRDQLKIRTLKTTLEKKKKLRIKERGRKRIGIPIIFIFFKCALSLNSDYSNTITQCEVKELCISACVLEEIC